tara:strand:+ start:969 stop:1127 length:159 start_codon:yes stop_codon:yes gene_type:complete
MTIRCPECEATLLVERLENGDIEVVNHFCVKVPLAEESQILATFEKGGVRLV